MKKILVADTSQTIKNVANSLLRQEGYDVVCTSDGLQAWDFVNTDKPNLVLVGTELSGISGLELCRQISDRAVSGDIPVIILLGKNDKYTKEELTDAGAKGRLLKPFSPNDLMRVVEKLVGPPEKKTVADETKMDLNKELEKESGYNLKWDDIKDIEDPQTPIESNDVKLDSKKHKENTFEIDASEDSKNPEMEINNGINESATPVKNDDYDHFVGEMKKEIEDSKSDSGKLYTIDKPVPHKLAPIVNKSVDKIDFSDLSPVSDKNRSESQKFSESDFVSTKTEKPKSPLASVGLSDDEINRLAEKVSKKLVEELASKIDKELILRLIKSSIEA